MEWRELGEKRISKPIPEKCKIILNAVQRAKTKKSLGHLGGTKHLTLFPLRS